MTRKTQSRSVGGFTLVELLVVMGIIAVLVSILVPVVNSARRSAYAADSRNQIKNLGNAIDRYYSDFSAYPGPYSNADLASAPSGVSNGAPGGSGRKTTGLIGKLSASENLTIALCGGWVSTGASPAWTFSYVPADLGKGPLTFGTPQRRMAAYIDATPQTLSIAGSSLDTSAQFGYNEALGVNTGVPEFIDKFPAAMPIIYIRAKVGAPASADTSGTLQYDSTEFCAYTPGNPAAPPNPGDNYAYPTWDAYFQNTSLTTTAKRQDTYMLISPGIDRKYGTQDDLTNTSN